jgi:hypothetical protein
VPVKQVPISGRRRSAFALMARSIEGREQPSPTPPTSMQSRLRGHCRTRCGRSRWDSPTPKRHCAKRGTRRNARRPAVRSAMGGLGHLGNVQCAGGSDLPARRRRPRVVRHLRARQRDRRAGARHAPTADPVVGPARSTEPYSLAVARRRAADLSGSDRFLGRGSGPIGCAPTVVHAGGSGRVRVERVPPWRSTAQEGWPLGRVRAVRTDLGSRQRRRVLFVSRVVRCRARLLGAG